MAQKIEKESLLEPLAWIFLLGITVFLLCLTSYNRGYEDGRMEGLQTGIQLSPRALGNALEDCEQNYKTCEDQLQSKAGQLGNCTEKLSAARSIFNRSVVACVLDDEYERFISRNNVSNPDMLPVVSCSELAKAESKFMRD